MIDEMKLEICSMEKRLEQEERLLLGAERGREDARRKGGEGLPESATVPQL